jgi:hypothetical protein
MDMTGRWTASTTPAGLASAVTMKIRTAVLRASKALANINGQILFAAAGPAMRGLADISPERPS